MDCEPSLSSMYKRKGKLPPKAQSERVHAKKRAEERFGVTLNRHDIRDIVYQIQNHSAIFVEKQSQRVSVFVVNLKGIQAFAVYDRVRQTIITFLDKYGEPEMTPQEAIRKTFKDKPQRPGPMWTEWQ